jgi:TonB-linked SusC/RagA family outer membrane protein
MPQIRYPGNGVPLFPLKLLCLFLIFPLLTQAQLKTISGVVTDESGTPLPGITVAVLNGAGTATDADGKFTLSNVAKGATISFTSAVHETFTLTVDDRTEYSIRMKARVGSLTDVVVVGYGRQKKVNLVGAASTVNIDEKFNSRPLPNVTAGLSGTVPGLSAIQNSGMAGRNGAALLIRGLGTVNNASPLIVVDGMPDVDINRINVNDIETISVLKDAASSSVYGSRAANGVILITTRSGKGMRKTQVTVNSNMAVEVPTKGFSFMADYARALHLHQVRALTGTLPSNLQFRYGTIDQWLAMGKIDPLRFPNTDWFDIIMRDGEFQNYNVSAVGGNDKSNFFISVGAKDEKGLQINNDYNQYNARFNFDYKLKDNMNAGVRFQGNWSKLQYALEEGFTDDNPTNTAGFDMQYAIAGITPYDPASGYFGGVMAYGEDPQAYNPYTVYVNMLNRQNRQEANGSMYWDWTPVKGLTGGLEYGVNYYNQFSWNANTPNRAFNFQTNSYGSRVYVGDNAGVSNATFTGYKTLLNAKLSYQHTFAGHHDVSGLFVYAEEYWYDRYQQSGRNDRLYPSLHEIDAALTDIQSTGGNSSSEGLRSYIGRFNYTGFNKYLLEANFRIDGSSKFLEGSRYGFFPSVAVGWRFTEEEFLSGLSRILSNGKLRVSYGTLGNNSGVGRYEQQTTLAAYNYIINGSVSRGFVNSKFVNQFLTWEETQVFNVGLELGFFDNRLTAEFDFYNRLTKGMNRPSDFSILLQGAFNPPRTNIGDMRNRGIEGTFSWRDKAGQIDYGVTLNASYNATKLLSWNEYLGRPGGNAGTNIFIGMPYSFVYAYEAIGIAQTWDDVYKAVPQGAQPGDILYKDLNGDGRIDGTDRKAYPYGQRNRPSAFFGLNGYVAWKGFDLVVFLQGSAGRKDFYLNIYNNVNFGNQRYASTWDLWTKPWSLENRGGEWPRLGGDGSNRDLSTFWMDDMSYLRVKNLQLGYSVPQKILSKVGINRLRIAGSAENIATITSFRGLDPEKAGNSSDVYPINKVYSLSIQLGL